MKWPLQIKCLLVAYSWHAMGIINHASIFFRRNDGVDLRDLVNKTLNLTRQSCCFGMFRDGKVDLKTTLLQKPVLFANNSWIGSLKGPKGINFKFDA